MCNKVEAKNKWGQMVGAFVLLLLCAASICVVVVCYSVYQSYVTSDEIREYLDKNGNEVTVIAVSPSGRAVTVRDDSGREFEAIPGGPKVGDRWTVKVWNDGELKLLDRISP